MRLFLTGFMGSGKTSVGRALASKTRTSFADLDALIEERAGRSISAIFAENGESYFRELESVALRELGSYGVVALGGGAFISPHNRSIIEVSGFSVFLYCELDTICDRLRLDTSRPLFGGREEMQRLYQKRLPFYRLANLTVDVTRMSIEEAASEICNRLNL